MFYSLTGKLVLLSRNRAVISCGGVGFDCCITETTYKELVGKNGGGNAFYPPERQGGRP